MMNKPKKTAHKTKKQTRKTNHKNVSEHKQQHASSHSKHNDTRRKPRESGAKKIENLTFFGMHAVREAWLNPERHVHGLYLTHAAAEEFMPHIKTAEKKGLKRPEPVICDKARLDASFPEGTVHQGIALRANLLEDYSAFDVIQTGEQRLKDGHKRSVIMILDQVTDPHNIGAIIRSASAFQITGMIVQKKHTPPLQGVAAKTACGGVDHLQIAHETNIARTMDELKDAGYYIIGLDERGEVSLENFTPPERCAFVLGAEGPGLRRLTKDNCDQMIKLPTGGAVGSLNVSNAAAICLYSLMS